MQGRIKEGLKGEREGGMEEGRERGMNGREEKGLLVKRSKSRWAHGVSSQHKENKNARDTIFKEGMSENFPKISKIHKSQIQEVL